MKDVIELLKELKQNLNRIESNMEAKESMGRYKLKQNLNRIESVMA